MGRKWKVVKARRKKKMDDKKIHKRKERKAKTALEMPIIWMEYLHCDL